MRSITSYTIGELNPLAELPPPRIALRSAATSERDQLYLIRMTDHRESLCVVRVYG